MKKVAVGVVLKGQEVLLIRRVEKEPGLDWCFPGGMVEESEEEHYAAEREILEETGITCKAVRKLAEILHPTKTDLTKVFWLCDYISGDAELIEPDQHEAVEWVTIDNAASLLEIDYTPFVQEVFQFVQGS